MPDTIPHSKTRIINILSAHREQLEAMGVKQIGLFGSYVHANEHPDSDIDLLVEFKPGMKNFDRFFELTQFLEDLLGRQIDLVTKESLSPYIGPKILKEVEYVEC